MGSSYEIIKEKLTAQNQQHLLHFWNDLTDDQRSDLIKDINELNLDEIQTFYKRATASLEEVGAKLDDRLQPIPESQYISSSRLTKEQSRKYEEVGLKAIAEGKVGVLLMAGGQGTRLGFAFPKGMYDVGLLSKKSLFRVQAERIRTLQRLAEELHGQHG
jgi:UDP-N-acetylglucosamine/UDP-N-acetylgalactosamine diphosphorylase